MAKKVSVHSKYKGIIVSKTEMRKLNTSLKAKMKDIADLLIDQLSYIGEECIRIARESGSYNDIQATCVRLSGMLFCMMGSLW